MREVLKTLKAELQKVSQQEPVARAGVAELDDDRYRAVMKRDEEFECCVTRTHFPDMPATHATILPSWGSVKRRSACFLVLRLCVWVCVLCARLSHRPCSAILARWHKLDCRRLRLPARACHFCQQSASEGNVPTFVVGCLLDVLRLCMGAGCH